MSRKFSNKKIIKPKAKKVRPKKNNTPKAIEVSPIEFSGGNDLFLIMSTHRNKQYNIDSTIDTWVKSLGTKADHCFVLENSMENVNHFTIDGLGKYVKRHDSYSPLILLEFLKQKTNVINRFNNICFCTDTTYVNVENFESDKKHWGYVSAMLPSSVEKLSKIDNKISPENVKMYHGESGFCLSSDIVNEISNMISKNDNFILDRWDSTIGYCMYKMGATFNHDDRVNLFPHTILNHSSKEIIESKSYGYLKFYDKKNIFKIF